MKNSKTNGTNGTHTNGKTNGTNGTHTNGKPNGVNGKQETKYLQIEGVKYDITAFNKKHPGGSVINFYNKMDASDPFREFHVRSPKA